jgi:hypothetical protein
MILDLHYGSSMVRAVRWALAFAAPTLDMAIELLCPAKLHRETSRKKVLTTVHLGITVYVQ